jgi:hypothetical protein
VTLVPDGEFAGRIDSADGKVFIAMVLISEAHDINCVFSPIEIAESTRKIINMHPRAAIDVRWIFFGQQNDFQRHSFF